MRDFIFLQDTIENGDVLAALSTHGFLPDRFVDATDRTPFEIHFRSSARPETRAVFVRDAKIHVDYLMLGGADLAALRDALESSLPHDDLATACERASKSPFPGDRAAALFQLAIARGPVPEPHVLRVLRDLLQDDHEGIRHSAVIAAAYFEWTEAEPLVDELIRRETNAAVLEQAQLLKGMYQPADRHPITGFERLVARSGGETEVVWGMLESGRELRVASIPQVVDNLSYLDLVEVEIQEGTAVIVRVLEKSGHRTLRADLGVDDARYRSIETELLRQRVRIEAVRPGRIGVAVPADVDLAGILGAFERAGVAWEQADPRVNRAGPDVSQRDDLYRAILADPDRNAPRRRYADALDEQGDELGEYIRLALEKTRGALDSSRLARFLELGAKMDVRLGGPLQGWVKSWQLDRGLVAKVTMDGAFFLAHGPSVFSRAPIQHVDFVDAKSMLGAIVQNPLLSRVRTLDLAHNDLGDHEAELLARSPFARRLVYLRLDANRIGRAGIEAIAGSPNLAGLRALYLDGNAVESPVSKWSDDGRGALVESVANGLLRADLVARFGRKAWMDMGPHLDRFRMCDVAG